MDTWGYLFWRAFNDWQDARFERRQAANIQKWRTAHPNEPLPPRIAEKMTIRFLRLSFPSLVARRAERAKEKATIRERRQAEIAERRANQEAKRAELSKRLRQKLKMGVLWLFAIFGALALALMIIMQVFHLVPEGVKQ